MTLTKTQARDVIAKAVNDAWTASPVTSAIALHWDNVVADVVDVDTDGRALPWARVTVRHQTSTQETIGGPSCRKSLVEGLLTLQIFTPAGDGHVLADQIADTMVAALRAANASDLWFFQVRVNEIGQDGPWFNSNLLADFRYVEAG